MRATCKMSNRPTTWPCAAPACPLFGDCIVEYQRKAAIRNTIGQAIVDFCNKTGKRPAAIMAEPMAFREMIEDREMAIRHENFEWSWDTIPLMEKHPSKGDYGVYLIPEIKFILKLSEEG